MKSLDEISNTHIKALACDVLQLLPYEPNEQQLGAIVAIAQYLTYSDERSLMLLSGYAGTGKTSLTGAIVKALSQAGVKCVLLAPTGRAAHIFSEYSGHPAFTIHRKIYRQKGYGSTAFNLAENKHTRTLFIVDEASMIANMPGDQAATFGTGRLLDDLITYVYNGQGCRLLLMGDDAQLPPVGQVESPALNENLMQAYGFTVYHLYLNEIARQESHSGVLHNATIVRQSMQDDECNTEQEPKLELEGCDDITAVTGEFLLETISDCYDRDGINDTIVITRSNKRATMFNQGIRNSILYREDELVAGDMLLVAKNNYYWAEEYENLDFIANGDRARVLRVRNIRDLYGFHFADITFSFPDYDNLEFTATTILDSLQAEAPSLTREQNEKLFQNVMADYQHLPLKSDRFKALRQDPYYNALQVKYAYAVTCHKAQGGQWSHVYVDQGYMTDDMLTPDYIHWLYTAFTRATEKLFLVNWPKEQVVK